MLTRASWFPVIKVVSMLICKHGNRTGILYGSVVQVELLVLNIPLCLRRAAFGGRDLPECFVQLVLL